MKKIILIIFFWTTFLMASQINILNISEKRLKDISNYPFIAEDLVSRKMYFSALPFIKEYLVTERFQNSRLVDRLIDDITFEVGIKQFEVMPIHILKRSRSLVIKYILAKKYFRMGKYQNALNQLGNILNSKHPVAPYAFYLKASVLSLTGKYASAISTYHQCINVSNRYLASEKDLDRKQLYEINRDYCVIGIPRSEFAAGKYNNAYSHYLDLPKESYVWPEILFEEAWNSFYLRDFNRTLGKLVTYNAPIFSHIFNPEIDTLKALTYMEMCLWDDARSVVENFYGKNYKQLKNLKRLVKKAGKDYKFYYLQAKKIMRKGLQKVTLKERILESIVKDATFLELFWAFKKGEYELKFIKGLKRGTLKKFIAFGLREALLLQRDLIGAHVRKALRQNIVHMDKTFEHMSYIKLEVLGRKKDRLYENRSFKNDKRGSLVFLKRTDKQYFWNFVGEFWADELGDHVFALKSECRQ